MLGFNWKTKGGIDQLQNSLKLSVDSMAYIPDQVRGLVGTKLDERTKEDLRVSLEIFISTTLKTLNQLSLIARDLKDDVK